MKGNPSIIRQGFVLAIREFSGSERARPRGRWAGATVVPTSLLIRSPEREGRIRSAGKDRSPPDCNNSLSRTNFLPINCGPRAYERKFVMPVRRLPSNPNLDHLKYQAKDLLKERTAHTLGVAQRVREFHPRFRRATDAEIFDAPISISDAQLTIAREYGFPSWARLKRHIERPTLSDRLDLPHQQRIENATFRRAVELLDRGDVAGLRAHLNPASESCASARCFRGRELLSRSNAVGIRR